MRENVPTVRSAAIGLWLDELTGPWKLRAVRTKELTTCRSWRAEAPSWAVVRKSALQGEGLLPAVIRTIWLCPVKFIRFRLSLAAEAVFPTTQ